MRIKKLQQIMEKNNLDAVALIPGANMRYLSGSVHMLMERPLVLFIPQNRQQVAVVPQLEMDDFITHNDRATIFSWSDEEGYKDAFEKALAQLQLSGKRLGVEGQKMRFFEGEILRKTLPDMQVLDASDPLAELRIIKDEDEIEAIRKAVQISELALQLTLEKITVGMNERQIANMLETNMEAVGGEGLAFETIVLGGANTALPHGRPGNYVLQEGDPILFDFGTKFNGYPADITRTFFMGEPNDHFREIYAAVKAANKAGLEAARPNISAGEVDDITRQYLVDAGFEAFIKHRTGHGLGLDMHEHPNINRGNDRLLEAGMVFTIEPGLYEQGVIGVRIEDDVVATGAGCESLTTFSRDIRVIGQT